MTARKILIAGANSAIAQEVARLYAAAGDRLYLLARDEGKLDKLAAELTDEFSGAVVGQVAGDLNELAANEGRVKAAIECLGGLDIALIAHGLLGDQIRSESDLEHTTAILRTNFDSPISLLLPIVNHFEEQGSGRLGVITSVAGERGRPRNYTYGAAKGGLTRYLQGVRSRLHGSAVRVVNLKLGPVDTPMTVDHEKNALFGEKKTVARGIVKALERGKHVVYLPRVWGHIMRVVRLLPEPIFQRFGFLSGR